MFGRGDAVCLNISFDALRATARGNVLFQKLRVIPAPF